MNIDYEAIATAVRMKTGSHPYTGSVKDIIEAYEAQKKAPEWVPLDLATVKQGQEVRYAHWNSDVDPVFFVCAYKGSFITDNGVENFILRGKSDWLMRAPKPKTVRVFVFKLGAEYGATTKQDITGVVGEDDIKVRE